MSRGDISTVKESIIGRGKPHQLSWSADAARARAGGVSQPADISVSVLLAVPDYLSSHPEYERLADLLAEDGERESLCEVVSLDTANPPAFVARSQKASLLYRCLVAAMYVRTLIRKLPRFRILHVVYPVGLSPLAWPLLIVLAGKFFGLRVVLDYPGPLTLSRLRGKSLLVQKFWHLSDHVLVPSKYQQQLVNMLGGRASCMYPNLADGQISPRKIDRVQPKLLVVTDLEEENNVACLVRAYKLVKQKYPRTELVIVGSGSQRADLERFLGADTRSGVTFVPNGDRRHRCRWFAACDLYVNCSTVDCLTRATLEAMAHGLPVLTTPLGGDLTAFHDHDNIISFSYNDHGALADRIIELVEEPSLVESLSRKARETAELLGRQMAPPNCRDLYQGLAAR